MDLLESALLVLALMKTFTAFEFPTKYVNSLYLKLLCGALLYKMISINLRVIIVIKVIIEM